MSRATRPCACGSATEAARSWSTALGRRDHGARRARAPAASGARCSRPSRSWRASSTGRRPRSGPARSCCCARGSTSTAAATSRRRCRRAWRSRRSEPSWRATEPRTRARQRAWTRDAPVALRDWTAAHRRAARRAGGSRRRARAGRTAPALRRDRLTSGDFAHATLERREDRPKCRASHRPPPSASSARSSADARSTVASSRTRVRSPTGSRVQLTVATVPVPTVAVPDSRVGGRMSTTCVRAARCKPNGPRMQTTPATRRPALRRSIEAHHLDEPVRQLPVLLEVGEVGEQRAGGSGDLALGGRDRSHSSRSSASSSSTTSPSRRTSASPS